MNVGGINIESIYLEHDSSDQKFVKARSLAHELRESVKKVLDKMESTGVVSKVESSFWATRIVSPIKSNDQHRLYSD